MKRLILFSGMGGDGRLMRPLQIPGIEVLAPDHLEPQCGETLAGYAERVAEANRIGSADVVGGASFGGMLAAEIASQRPVAGLILLGSCVRARLLPKAYWWLDRFGGSIPDSVLEFRTWRPLLRWRFKPLTADAETVLLAMARTCTTSQLRKIGRMIAGWPGVDRLNCPTLSIHGDLDRILPLHCAEPGLILKNAGHAFTLTHTKQTVSAIRQFLESRL